MFMEPGFVSGLYVLGHVISLLSCGEGFCPHFTGRKQASSALFKAVSRQ